MTDKDTIPFRGIYNDPGCYRPLNYHSKEIRYLEVAPGYGKEPLLCTLGYTSLVDDVAPFEALSYTWGDISTTVMLNLRYLDEHSRQQSEYQTQHYKITPNLQGALLRLRYEDQPRKIWVDAVCINQVDDTERTEQVQIMGLVYSIAQRVLVWLGEEDLSSNIALKACKVFLQLEEVRKRALRGQWIDDALGQLERGQEIFNEPHVDDDDEYNSYHEHFWKENLKADNLGYFRTLHFACMADDETADVLLRTVSNLDLKWGRLSYSEQLQIIHWTILQSVNDMLARPWFKRTWVVQEVFRARKVGGPKFHGTPDAVIHIGGKAILWGAFASFINGFKNQIHISRLGRLKHIEPNDLTDWKLFLRTWQDLWNRYIQTGDTYDILQLMHKTTSFLATDPRDKFFAMMQLARNTREDERLHPLVRTNYNKTLSQVTRDFTEWHILRTRRVGVLNMLSLKKETEIGEPSWVPNILNPTDECPFLRLPSYIHDEYDGFLSSTKFSRDGIHPFQVRGRSLFARGMQICRVAHVVSKLVADPASRKIENPVKVIGEEWGLVNLALDILNRDKKPRLEPENFSSDLLKMVGCYGDEEAEAGFELHRRGHAMEINDQKLVDIYFDRASSWCHHRRLFLDDRGSMGLCPEGTEDGDIVVMLQSSFVPHVLRVLDDGPYGMLGPCLYYGGKWLQGEADDYQKMYNVQPEWFEIW